MKNGATETSERQRYARPLRVGDLVRLRGTDNVLKVSELYSGERAWCTHTRGSQAGMRLLIREGDLARL